MKVTLKNIAKKSGVSIATASRILKRTKTNYTDKELKVIQIAQNLGYPYIAYKKHSKKTHKIAIILKMGIGEFYPSLLNGFIESSYKSNYQFSMSMIDTNKKTDPTDDIIEIVNQYDGACILITKLIDKDYLKIKKHTFNKPIISIAPIPNPIFNTVSFDSYRGGYLTAKSFFENGYNNLGLICGPNNSTEANYRKNGFIDFVNTHKSMKINWIYNGDYSIESGHDAYLNLKKNNIKKITLFSCNDSMALGFMKEAIEDGIKIPQDLRVSGYDNLPICNNISPSLSSINTDYKKLGKQVILTFDQMKNQELSESILSLIPIELINRKSTSRK